MLLVTKGAPEAVLSRAVAVEVDGLAHPLDELLAEPCLKTSSGA